jgi:hypothetical protein
MLVIFDDVWVWLGIEDFEQLLRKVYRSCNEKFLWPENKEYNDYKILGAYP